jgi:hypothetical protein
MAPEVWAGPAGAWKQLTHVNQGAHSNFWEKLLFRAVVQLNSREQRNVARSPAHQVLRLGRSL